MPDPVARPTTMATPKNTSQNTTIRKIQRSYSVIQSRIANILVPRPHGHYP